MLKQAKIVSWSQLGGSLLISKTYLSFVFLLCICGAFQTWQTIGAVGKDTVIHRVLNESGRQRMLSQRIQLLASQRTDGDAIKAGLQEKLIQEFEDAHGRIVGIVQEPGRTAADLTRLKNLYFGPDGIDQKTVAFIEAARAQLDDPRIVFPGDPAWVVFLDQLDEAVFAFEDAANSVEHHLHYHLLSFSMLAAIFFLGTWLLVLRPSKRRLNLALSESIEGRERLKEQNEALHAKENELASTNALLQDVIDSMEQGVVVFSDGPACQSKVVLNNGHASQALHMPKGAIRRGMPHSELVDLLVDTHDLGKSHENILRDPDKQEGGFQAFEFDLKSLEGGVAKLTVSQRSSGGLMLIATDVTSLLEKEKQRAELAESLSHYQKIQATGQLTGGIAHDFNNLLTVIGGNAELILLDCDDPDQRVIEIQEAAARGARLTHHLLAFSRKQPLQPKSMDVNQSAQSMHELLERTLGGSISIEWFLGDALWNCFADIGQVENAILNLALNARDAMPEGGSLTIETGNTKLNEAYCAERDEVSPGDYVMISVSDTGVGMSNDTKYRAFDPFFTTKDIGKGTGLGLSMVYGFAKQSGGHVSIYSEQNEGTTVRLYLPRTEDKRASTALNKRTTPTANSDERILVVEDDPSVTSYVERSLISLGYIVTVCGSGREGIKAVENAKKPFDLVLTDVVLPGGMNGPEMIEALGGKLRHARVLYMSGYTENAVVHNGRLDEDVAFIGKPFTLTRLAQCIRELLDDDK